MKSWRYFGEKGVLTVSGSSSETISTTGIWGRGSASDQYRIITSLILPTVYLWQQVIQRTMYEDGVTLKVFYLIHLWRKGKHKYFFL